MPHRKSVDWGTVRAHYEQSGVSVSELAHRHQVSKSAIYARARRQAWQRQKPNADVMRARVVPHASLVRRLYRSIDRKLAQLEARMERADEISIADHERETRAIGQLIRNIEKIAGLEQSARPGKLQPAPPTRGEGDSSGVGDADEIRRELAERILRFRELRNGDAG